MTRTKTCHPREELVYFVHEMERELRRNDHKAGWGDDSRRTLFKRLQEEVDELRVALGLCCPRCRRNASSKSKAGVIRSGAADVANFAMMIADNFGGLRD